MSDWGGLSLVLLAVIGSFFFSGSETGLVTVNRIRLRGRVRSAPSSSNAASTGSERTSEKPAKRATTTPTIALVPGTRFRFQVTAFEWILISTVLVAAILRKAR